MNLTKSFPRSPKIKMCGLVMLPRIIDKARAYSSKTLGEYIFPCPLDKIILKFLSINEKEIIQLASESNDKEIALRIEKQLSSISAKDKEKINQKILDKRPENQESLFRFNELRDRIDSTRTDIATWVDLLDLDENKTTDIPK